MTRVFLALLLALAPVPVTAAEQVGLPAISDYFNGLTTAEATFTQVNDDGSLSTGRLYLHRPGRMRFEYDPPDQAVVIAGGGAVVIHDPKSNQPPESYPLRKTPLSILLARKVDLDRADMVVSHRFDGTDTIVTAQDPENPDQGRIDLYFGDEPVALKKWTIHDSAGGRTTVILGDMKTGGTLGSSLFSTPKDTKPTDR